MSAIEQVTRYRFGGKDYLSPEDAERAKEISEAVSELHAILTPAPRTDAFSNGEGYVQQDEEAVRRYTAELGRLIRRYHDKDTADRYDACPTGFVGRILDDSGSPFSGSYWRLCRIDSQFREWGQLYFANNPNPDAKAVKA